MDAVVDDTFPEIDDHPQFHSGQPQVGQSLHLEDRVVLGDRLAFDNDRAADDDINTLWRGECYALVRNRQRHLTLHRPCAFALIAFEFSQALV